jgi:stage II sporulation protein D
MVSPIKSTLRLIIILFVFTLVPFLVFAQKTNYVRVAIIQNVRTVSLNINGPYEITNPAGEVLSKGGILKTTVTIHRGGILLGGNFFKTGKVLISVGQPNTITVNDRMFRGEIQLIKNKDESLSVVNRIDLENYVRGILYHEASHYWPMEALKAQAIICRTYAIYETQKNKNKNFDLTSDVYSQVYGGMISERYRTNKAVDQTKGTILTYQGEVFPTYYSATCGGYTEDSSMLWNIDLAPLRGVFCGFCKDSPHFKWNYVLSLAEIKDKLVKAGFKIGNIKNIVIFNRDKTGRIIDLKIVSENKELKIPAKNFRNIIGPNIIRSTNFNVDVIDKDACLEGIGWGHGVGMCQWGAYFMAKQGYTAEQILKYYYPYTDVKTIGF